MVPYVQSITTDFDLHARNAITNVAPYTTREVHNAACVVHMELITCNPYAFLTEYGRI